MNQEKGMVYLYGFSLRQQDKSESLLKIFNEQIRKNIKIILVLLHDGVIGVTQKSKLPRTLERLLQMPISIKVLTSDILARGMDLGDLRRNINAIGYEDLVDILVNNRQVISWL
ncbi:MAG: sulfurtransferase complex subunit TusB [Promethearchaeota archaeon]